MKSIASGRAAGVTKICSTSSSTPIPSSSAPSLSSSVASLYGGQVESCSEEENGAGISRWLEVWEPRVDALCASVSMMVKGERSQREKGQVGRGYKGAGVAGCYKLGAPVRCTS